MSNAITGHGISLEVLNEGPGENWIEVGELVSLKRPALSRNAYDDTNMIERREHRSVSNMLRIGPVTGRVNVVFGGSSPIRGTRIVPGENDAIDFSVDGGARAASVAGGFYQSQAALATAAQAAMLTAAPEIAWFVFYGAALPLRFRIHNETPQGGGGFTPFDLLTLTGPNAASAIWDELGFSRAADHTGADTYTADFDTVVGDDFHADPLTAQQLQDQTLDELGGSRTWRIRNADGSDELRFQGGLSLFEVEEVGVDTPLQADFELTIARLLDA